MYITFEEYKQLNGKADEQAFPVLEFLAKKRLDYWTFGRIQEATEDIKYCMLLLIDQLNDEKNGESDVSAFSNDGVSVTLTNAKTNDEKMNDIYKRVVEILPIELVSLVVGYS